jgi:hypothetical protein
MKKIFNWTLSITLLLISASAVTYTLHYFIFHDVHHIFIYMIGDFGFLFLDVLLVILFIERLLNRRAKKAVMQKLNMVIGAFFSEVGLGLLKQLWHFVENAKDLEKEMEIRTNWGTKEFRRAQKATENFSYRIKLDIERLPGLRDFLTSKRTFMLRLLENPNLLEHEKFTDLLWAVFHLTEELEFREDKLMELPKSDYNHLAGDLQRAYCQITCRWIDYTLHLRESYPFLYSLAARVNPMNPHASVIVQ